MDPRWAEAVAKAAAALNAGDTDGAIDAAEHLLDHDDLPDDAWVAALTIRGMAALRDGQLPDALEDFDAALQVAPGDAQARLSRAAVQTQMGMIDEAVADLKAAAASDPEGPLGAAARAQLDLAERGLLGVPPVEYELGWGVLALSPEWEPQAEALSPPGHHWRTSDGSHHLMVWGLAPGGGASLGDLFDEMLVAALGALTGADVAHSDEPLGEMPAHLLHARGEVAVGAVLLRTPGVVLAARLVDHGAGPSEVALQGALALLNGARLHG